MKNSNSKIVKTRFAPSPTGFLHVGGLRTALFNYLFAKQNNGSFVLRIEDTDRERFVEGAESDIIKTLNQFGLKPDEGPSRQSEKLEIYKTFAQKLIDEGKAYEEKTEKGTAVRFKLSKSGFTEFTDMVYGGKQFKNELLKDPVILKSDGYPVYNFANVIDDHEASITHVIRGEEFISSTPIHIQIYQALGWETPEFAHVPLILDEQRKKLSKRTGDVAVNEYLKKGYIKEALLNFIALLGWNPKSTDEIFSLDELVRVFALEKINKSGAIFDVKKLDYVDREWRKKLKLEIVSDPLYNRTKKILKSSLSDHGEGWGEAGDKILSLIFPQILDRIQGPSNLEEILPEFHFYFKRPEYENKLLIWKTMAPDQIKQNLQMMKEFIQNLDENDFKKEILETKTKAFLASRGVPLVEALWPLRVAISGQKNSPGPFEIIEVFTMIDKKEIFERIDEAIGKIG